jgi:hypothetical protein
VCCASFIKVRVAVIDARDFFTLAREEMFRGGRLTCRWFSYNLLNFHSTLLRFRNKQRSRLIAIAFIDTTSR